MEDRPSFRRRRDALQFLAAIFVPWLLLGLSVAPALAARGFRSAGAAVGWAGGAVTIWFYLVSGLAGLVAFGLWVLGIRRLIRYDAYRTSAYGWSWLLLTWANLAGLGAAVGH